MIYTAHDYTAHDYTAHDYTAHDYTAHDCTTEYTDSLMRCWDNILLQDEASSEFQTSGCRSCGSGPQLLTSSTPNECGIKLT